MNIWHSDVRLREDFYIKQILDNKELFQFSRDNKKLLKRKSLNLLKVTYFIYFISREPEIFLSTEMVFIEKTEKM